MKTKLLKKIRKQYSIIYYPNGWEPSEGYHVPTDPFYFATSRAQSYSAKTKDACIDWIMHKVRNDYKKYSRKYNKDKYKGIKVWYNG